MKKYILVLVAVLSCCAVLVIFSVPDRIEYAFNGMGAYAHDDYNKLVADLPNGSLDIDFSTYKKSPITVYKYNEDVYLNLESIVYNGNSYTFKFVSYGKSSFSKGDIICFEENNEDVYVKNDVGEFVFQISGVGSLKNDTVEYSFSLYPKDENGGMKEFTTMSICIPIDKLVLVSYERI